MQFKSYDPGFTQIEIWFRFIFLLFTFIVTCWFSHTLRRYVVYDWSIEQKWMSVLLPLLLFYNSKRASFYKTMSTDLTTVRCRSILSADTADQLLVPGHAGRRFAGDIPVFAAHVLAVHLPRPTTERTKILDLLFAKVDCRCADLVMRNSASHMGEVQRATGPDLQPFRGHR